MARLRTHPGKVLREEYLAPLGLSARALAKELGVPANRLTEIKKELSQMLNRPEDPAVWWEKGGRRNRVA